MWILKAFRMIPIFLMAEMQEECPVPEESNSFDDVLKDAREQADRINGQVQEKDKKIEKDYER